MGQHLVFGLMVMVGSVIFYQVFLLLRVSQLSFVPPPAQEDSCPHSRWSSKVTRAPAIDSVLALIMPIAPPPMIKQSLIFSNPLLATMPHQQ
jgi:hypothetical protein